MVSVLPTLLSALDGLDFYAQRPPRSLGREWFEQHMSPLLTNECRKHSGPHARPLWSTSPVNLRSELQRAGATQALVTGGGAHHGLLVERLRALSGIRIDVPERQLVDFKEAIIFALLGLLRWRGEANALASVTGATATA